MKCWELGSLWAPLDSFAYSSWHYITASINWFQLVCKWDRSSGKVESELTITWQTVESDSFICVREKKNETASPEVIILDLKNNNNVIRRPIKADSAIMHWTKQVIALKAQSRTLQIFDLGAKSKLKSTTMNEDVVFWKWFSDTTLGLVTDTTVYHWNVFDANEAAPVEVFKRNQNLAVCQEEHRRLALTDST